MRNVNTWGALSAFICGATYVFGFVLLTTMLADSGYGNDSANLAEVVAFIFDNQTLMVIWNLSIYVVNGLALAALSVTLSIYFARHLPQLSQFIKSFGLLWATLVVGAGMVANVGMAEVVKLYATAPDEAAALWRVVQTIENGLGGGNEIAGGVWAILLAAAMVLSGTVSRALAVVTLLIGVSGLLTLVPVFGEIPGAIFGLGYIVWFFWIAAILARAARSSAT